MNDLNREMEDNAKVIEWVGQNIGDLPMIDQLLCFQAYAEFANKVKPIYIRHLLEERDDVRA